jgi:hypothetical protein
MHPVEISRPHSGRSSWQIGLLGAAGVAVAVAQAQTVTPPPAVGATANANSAVVLLSPFTVNTTQDTGYQASSSLGGIGFNTTIGRIGTRACTAIALGSVGNEGTSDQFILNNNFQSTVLNPFNTAVLSDGSPATEGPRCCRSGTRERFADSRWRKPYGFRYAVILTN